MRSIIVTVLICVAACSSGFAQQSAAGKTLVQQPEWKSDYLLKVSQFIHAYDGKQMFAKWICLGKTEKFRQRINQSSVFILVDPGLKSMAEYRTFSQTIIIRAEPKDFFLSIGFDGKSSFLLWHEAIHAISHGHQTGAITPSHPFRSAPTSVAPTAQGDIESADAADTLIDHYYINWAESCIAGLPFLERLEDILKANGKDVPSDSVKTLSQKLWKQFIKNCNQSIFGHLPDEKERKELEDMMGFHFDTTEILNGYLSLDYPMEYFGDYITDDQVWKLFPTAEQIGGGGLKASKHKDMNGKVSAEYSKAWSAGPTGRVCGIHLNLYGSNEISTVVWNAARQAQRGNKTAVPNVGDEAFIYDLGPNNSYRAVAKFRNAHVLMTDMDIMKETKGPISVKRRAINWTYVKWIFKNMEALGVPPVPAGVETSMEKLKNEP